MWRSRTSTWLFATAVFSLALVGPSASQSCEILGTEALTGAAQAAKYLVYPEGRVVRFGDLAIRFNSYSDEKFYFEVKAPEFHQPFQLKPFEKLLFNVCEKEVTIIIGTIHDSTLKLEPPWVWFVSAF